MEEKILYFLNKNLFDISSVRIDNYKAGTFPIDKSQINEDPIRNARLLYLNNYCLKTPVRFEIPNEIDGLEKCCMLVSFNDFSYLNSFPMTHSFFGALPENSSTPILIIKTNNTSLKERYPFRTKKYFFKNVFVEALTIYEQSVLIMNMMKTYSQCNCPEIRKMKVQAYLDRIFFERNEYDPNIRRIAEYYNSLINNSYKELEQLKDEIFCIDLKIAFKIPPVYKQLIELQLANVYFCYGLYKKACKIYSRFQNVHEEIDCLIKIGKIDRAVYLINSEIEKLTDFKRFDNKVLYCDLNMKLAKLLNEDEYYEKAFNAYKSFEPLYQKGISEFKKADFIGAKLSFERALKLSPECESILYSYACTLCKLEEYSKAIDVYNKLIEKDKRNPEYLRNLSLCYFSLENLEKCMGYLRKSALYDFTSMQIYFTIATKNRIKDDILWCLSKMDYLGSTKDSIDYLIRNNIVNKEEMIKYLKKNPKLREIIPNLF